MIPWFKIIIYYLQDFEWFEKSGKVQWATFNIDQLLERLDVAIESQNIEMR